MSISPDPKRCGQTVVLFAFALVMVMLMGMLTVHVGLIGRLAR